MNKKEHIIWVEKYRPDTLDNYIGNEQLKAKLGRFISTGDVPHILLSGPAGTGKTTAAKIIANNVDADILYINASDENNVDTVRNKIKNFASTIGFRSLKIIILDEADYLTPNAQAALRNLMEVFSRTTRFILTCNYVERLIDPLVSRTQQFHIVPPSKAEVAKHIAIILNTENIKYNLKDLKVLIDAYYPDIRKILNECQSNVVDGEMSLDIKEIVASDIKLKILGVLISKIDKKKKFSEIRQIIANARIRDFSDFYRLLYERVEDIAPTKISELILVIAEGLFKDGQVPDKEINAMATLINILHITD